MEKKELEGIILRYNELLEKHGVSPQALGWNNGRHNLRFKILLSQWNFSGGESILDFGCGFGDLYGYCQQQGLKVDYAGIDINKNLIESGKKKYPGIKLSVCDALSEGLNKKYDFIFSSGVHNIRLQDNWQFIKDTFQLFSQQSQRGFAVNFLSAKADIQYPNNYYADPAKVVDLAYSFSKRITLRNDYMPFEFTVFVDKADQFDPEWVVYPEYKPFV